MRNTVQTLEKTIRPSVCRSVNVRITIFMILHWYFRHAVLVAPTSGHPYNQLALLEAGRGNRLAAVALYVRAMCVPCPFPGAPANLTQTLSKLLASR